MTKFICSMCLFALVSINSFCQDVTKSKLRVGNRTYDYYEAKPAIPVKSILILLPAAGEKPKSIFSKTKLADEAMSAGFITISLETPVQMFANQECIDELDELLKLKTEQYHLTHADVVIGGLSNGGAISLCYAEYLNSKSAPIKLKAVFAIDPPADLTRIYASAESETKYYCPLIVREGNSVKSDLDNAFGGSPLKYAQAYILASAFTATAADGGNARFLKDLPVRLYSEPDLAFVQKTYCPALQFNNLNAFDLEKLIAYLKINGNGKASYITTAGKGFHSWNIVDAKEFVRWIVGL